jgi:hypothetical protein
MVFQAARRKDYESSQGLLEQGFSGDGIGKALLLYSVRVVPPLTTTHSDGQSCQKRITAYCIANIIIFIQLS